MFTTVPNYQVTARFDYPFKDSQVIELTCPKTNLEALLSILLFNGVTSLTVDKLAVSGMTFDQDTNIYRSGTKQTTSDDEKTDERFEIKEDGNPCFLGEGTIGLLDSKLRRRSRRLGRD